MSVMSATENNASRSSYDDQFDEMHLFSPQELSFDDSFGQDLDHFPGIFDTHGLQNFDDTQGSDISRINGNHNTSDTRTPTPVPAVSDKRPTLRRRARSNPFYIPSRQIMNLVQKKKISKKAKKDNSEALVAMLSSSKLDHQDQRFLPQEYEEKNQDAGSSCNIPG